GYWFGKKSGKLLFERKDSFLFKKKHLEQARDFYDKKGGSAIIIARFLPIVRTFAPIVAGVVEMDFKKFVHYNVVGALIWVFSLVSLGFVLGENQYVKEYLDKIVIGIFIVTTFPVLWKILRFNKKP
ncbi:MAG: DedA family protein, partial [Bacteroidota bacterium]